MTFLGTPIASTASRHDVEVIDPPADSISSIQFSPFADLLAVGSWDNSVRVYEIDKGRQSRGKAMLEHTAPVLSVCWNKEGQVFSGGADGAGRMLDVATGQGMQVAEHDATIKVVKWVDAPGSGLLATGSWDRTIKFWDLRQSNPVAIVNLPERCYSFDIQFPHLVVGTAGRVIQFYDLFNLGSTCQTLESPLRLQTRVIACLPNPGVAGFAIGSIEGRVAIRHGEAQDTTQSLVFKCHRRDSRPNSKDQDVFPVNALSFHPIYGTLSTAGSDGTVCFWDTNGRARLQTFVTDCPVTSTAFNHDGSIFAYANSYDWYKGHMGMIPGHPNKLMLHACKDEEIKPRKSYG